jgi:hypothetical protein
VTARKIVLTGDEKGEPMTIQYELTRVEAAPTGK